MSLTRRGFAILLGLMIVLQAACGGDECEARIELRQAADGHGSRGETGGLHAA